ncbi:MAG: hypothetical protein ACOYMA_11550 [Bacteroidia bacterium]
MAIGELQVHVKHFQTELNIQKTDFIKRIYFSNCKIESLKIEIANQNKTIAVLRDSLEVKISTTNQIANKRINIVEESLSKNSLYGIIAVLLAFIFVVLIYLVLNNKLSRDKTELADKIRNTKSELEKESANLDKQLLDIIEKQLKVADKLNQQSSDIEHTFHKNSANELMRITNYANTLEPNSPESVALLGSLSNLRNYFKLSKYEITDFTGRDYDERIPMNVKKTIYDELLPLGKEIISKTLKPQIKYKGVVIQDAEVITKYNN